MALESALNGSNTSSFNFGPSTPSLSVKTVTELARSVWPEETEVDYFEKSGNSEAGTLGLDPSLAVNSLKWESFWSQEEAVRSSIDWWVKVLKNQMDPKNACLEDIRRVLNG